MTILQNQEVSAMESYGKKARCNNERERERERTCKLTDVEISMDRNATHTREQKRK
jgi:hypothetical protein